MSEPGDESEPVGAARQLLMDVLAGTRTLQDPALLAACANPSFARRLEHLLALQARLDRAADAEALAVAAPATTIDARLRAFTRARLDQQARRRPWRLLLALAAAMLIGGGALLFWPPATPNDVTMGVSGNLRVEPDYAGVHWQGSSGRLWFQVRLQSRAGDELERSEPLRSNSWAPTRHDLPGQVVFELWLVDSSAQDGRRLARQAFGRDGQSR